MPMPSLRAGSSSGFGGADTYKLTSCFSWNTEIVNWLLVIICRNIPSPFTTISDLWVHFINFSSLEELIVSSPDLKSHQKFLQNFLRDLAPSSFQIRKLGQPTNDKYELISILQITSTRRVFLFLVVFRFVSTWSAINLRRTTFGKY